MEPIEKSLDDYVDIMQRRKWSLIVPTVIVFLASAALALLLTPVYKSTATILIEQQEIPPEFVMASVTSYAEQRLQSINQKIMSSTRLLEIINRFGLYQELRGTWATEEIVDKMREDTLLETVSAEVIDRRSGRPSEATIAFTLSYQGKETPEKVQQVANVLTSLFLDENLQVRTRQTRETAQFLEDELKKVKSALNDVDTRLSAFKKKNVKSLPDLLQLNLQNLSTVERSIESLQEQLRSRKESEGRLIGELANVAPELEATQKDRLRLEELKVELMRLKSRFTAEYPDVRNTEAEIVKLERQLAEGKSVSEISKPNNPAYITLASQLTSTQAEIRSILEQIRRLTEKSETYQRYIETTPKVEETYNALMAEQNSIKIKHDDLMLKLMEARVSQGLETEQKGERFTLIDPARLPEKPFKPNRLAIFFIGVVLSVGAGIGTAALREYSDASVHGSEHLTTATPFPVLASLPVIVTPRDISRQRVKTAAWATGIALAVVCGIVFFHYQVMDLTILWVKVMRRMAI